MRNTSGPIPYHATQKVCQYTNPHMSSKRRRSASSKGNTRIWRSGRNSNTSCNPTLFSLPSNNRDKGNPTLKSDRAPRSPSTTPRLIWQPEFPATTTGSHVGLVVARTGTVTRTGTVVPTRWEP